MDQATAFKSRIGDILVMEPCTMTDDELGLLDLIKIMPDTWNNVPQPVCDSIEVLKKAAMEQRRMLEQIKIYSISSNTKIISSTEEVIEDN